MSPTLLNLLRYCVTAVCLSLLLAAALESRADDLAAKATAILARNCLECHNASDRKGGLNLAKRDDALRGGDSGAALAPGDAKSLLLSRIAGGEMPPKERPKLSAGDQKVLREWVASGASWAEDPINPFRYSSERRAGYDWWSLQPVRRVEPPPVNNAAWPANAIDHFVLAKLEAAGLTPSAEADRRALIRRLSFDLTGLPPSPEEVQQFVDDPNPKAYQALVDRLLASPHYGEHWARHWLDIVRYGESQGFERNKLRPSVWKYRDFVVEAFNSDLPYDDFVRWQLAGDVLRPDDPLAVIASGFLALGPYDLTAYNNGTPDMRAFAREEELEGLVATVCQTFMGLTVNCSRCHDHKFDPITQKEFYQISAAVGGTYQGDERECLSESGRAETEKRRTELREQIAKLMEHDAQRSRLEAVERLLQGGPIHTTRPQQPGPWHILARGDFKQPGEIVSPGGIAAITSVPADWNLKSDATEAERRKALATWIASPDNPLTARVIVNRLWSHHFGAGLVRLPNDFGFQGGLPTHPELLDLLAAELVQPAEGKPWSLKHIHKLIVMSAAYRQQSGGRPYAQATDADNRLIWRRPRQRLEAESFRDTVLAVSGELDRRIGGPGYRDFKVSSSGNNETYTVFDAVGPEFSRRTLYRTTVRTGTSPLLDVLDCPDLSVTAPRRSVTSTPLQALSLLNNTFMEHAADKFAERLKQERPDSIDAQVQRAHWLAFSREPQVEEVAFAQKFIADHGLPAYCLVLFNLNEFMYID